MKTLILAALVALTVVLGGCATSGDFVGTRADSAFPLGSTDSAD
jgi:outer membrane lipoprotein-sorting protein